MSARSKIGFQGDTQCTMEERTLLCDRELSHFLSGRRRLLAPKSYGGPEWTGTKLQQGQRRGVRAPQIVGHDPRSHKNGCRSIRAKATRSVLALGLSMSLCASAIGLFRHHKWGTCCRYIHVYKSYFGIFFAILPNYQTGPAVGDSKFPLL